MLVEMLQVLQISSAKPIIEPYCLWMIMYCIPKEYHYIFKKRVTYPKCLFQTNTIKFNQHSCNSENNS